MRTNVLTLLASLALITACKRETDDEPPPVTPDPTTGTVEMSFAFVSGDDAFDMDATYQDGAGNHLRFDNIKFYVSDIHLSDDDDNEVAAFDGTVLLVDASAANNVFALGEMSPVHVHEAHIALGLDSELNHADPTVAPYPLNVAGMHWDWNPAAGYKFLVFDGMIDGNVDGDFNDTEDIPFLYHCATDALLRETHVHIHANVTAGTTATLEAKVDVAVLLSGLNLLTNPVAMGADVNTTTAMDSLVVAIDEHD